jgi:hypothetical protein
LRDLAMGRLKEQRSYWEKLLALKPVASRPTPAVRRLLRRELPEDKLPHRIVHRQAGLGSLGRQRFTALAPWRGGMVAREAKALTTSAWWWLHDQEPPIQYQQITRKAVRVADPFLKVHDDWVVRRLAPDCSRIELRHLSGVQDECKLLWMMGWETANVHLGTLSQRAEILRDLKRRKGDWLSLAARRMRDATVEDWRSWRAR